MGENVESTAEAVEYWKQARFHLGRLLKTLESDVDPEDFREEFVDGEFEQAVFDAVEEQL